MRREAEAAQVVITNHSLLAIDAAKGGKVLPEHEQVVLDESHHLEDAATEAFTVKIAASRITSLLSLKTLRANTKEKKRDAIERQARITWQELERRYEEGARGNNNRVALPSPVEEGLQLATLLQKLAKELEDNKPGNLAHQPKEDKLYDKLVQRVRNLASDVRQVFSVEEGDYVHCMEYVGDAGKASIEVSRIPLNVAPLLQQSLFDRCPVICTSATLATGNGNASFSYFKSRVGIERAIERVLPTVFDYQQNALLYVPRDLPSPNYETHRDAYEQAVIVRMLQLVHISQGRAFLLFNSRRMLERAYACFLTADMEYPLLAQLEGVSRDGLIQQFRENGNAVLFGLKSFWEGVDVQGEALSLVVIDKLPFSVPGDPVREARRELLDSPFKTYDLPQVILQLKQGVGRLIRSHEDRGCMAILDTRIHTRWDEWGKDICKALPPAVKTSRLQDVERFFN
jgi:Rad3-related DNA helicase